LQFEKQSRSQFWVNFDEAVNRSRGCPVCVCRGCGTEMEHPGRNEQKTTTSLKRHSQSCNLLKRYRQNASHTHPIIAKFFGSKTAESQGKLRLTTDSIREAVLKFFVTDNIPFNQANNPHFQQLIHWMMSSSGVPSVTTISRRTIRTDLTRHAQAAKADLRSILAKVDSRISLALDCWTSRNGFAFLSICL
jgi:hypothetical protein